MKTTFSQKEDLFISELNEDSYNNCSIVSGLFKPDTIPEI